MDAGFNEDLKRIEVKVDKLTDAVARLILVEERQTAQGVRIGALETSAVDMKHKVDRVDRKVDRWIHMGMGAWGVLVTLFVIFELVVKVQQ